MTDRRVNLLDQVQRIPQVIVNIWELLVDTQRQLIVLHCWVRRPSIIVRVS